MNINKNIKFKINTQESKKKKMKFYLILFCLILTVSSKLQLPNYKLQSPTSLESKFFSNKLNKPVLRNGDVLDNLYFKFIEKILPYVIVFDDFDSIIVLL